MGNPVIEATVASLRLDALLAAGLGTSRSRVAREIRAGRAKVNGRPVENPSQSVKEGDTLSLHPRGGVLVARVAGTTRKGRIRVVLQRLTG